MSCVFGIIGTAVPFPHFLLWSYLLYEVVYESIPSLKVAVNSMVEFCMVNGMKTMVTSLVCKGHLHNSQITKLP